MPAVSLHLGITPAWAGKSIQSSGPLHTPGDHPRVGGEKAVPARPTPSNLGSPPRGRGKVLLTFWIILHSGITPAWAGKSAERREKAPRPWDSPPRGRGKVNFFVHPLNGVGSPPRGRGKVQFSRSTSKQTGITPAWAGKSRRCRYALTSEWDHPRVGGEKEIDVCIVHHRVGSPPRGRGKADQPARNRPAFRITPAWAGKSGN